jgi:hypothetical protein
MRPTRERTQMKLIDTLITEDAVYVRFADQTDPEKANKWIDFQVPFSELKHPSNTSTGLFQNINKIEEHKLGVIRRSAIERAIEILRQEAGSLPAV